MRRTIIGAIIFSAFLARGANAGIPVFDAAGLVQAVLQVQSWVEQLQGMDTSISRLERQIENSSGTRGLGAILNNRLFREYLPPDIARTYNRVSRSGYGGLSGNARLIRDATRIYNCEGMSEDFEEICSSALNKNSQDQAFAEEGYEKATQRNEQIQDLMSEINNTDDEKSIAELNARIAGEGVAVQNEANRIALAQQMQIANDKAQAQRQTEWFIDASHRESTLSGFVYEP